MSLSDTVRGQQLCRGAHLQGWVYDHSMGGNLDCMQGNGLLLSKKTCYSHPKLVVQVTKSSDFLGKGRQHKDETNRYLLEKDFYAVRAIFIDPPTQKCFCFINQKVTRCLTVNLDLSRINYAKST